MLYCALVHEVIANVFVDQVGLVEFHLGLVNSNHHHLIEGVVFPRLSMQVYLDKRPRKKHQVTLPVEGIALLLAPALKVGITIGATTCTEWYNSQGNNVRTTLPYLNKSSVLMPKDARFSLV
mmetsp:Transcript_29188/g.80181  ORF Transcript_29188/g.80181 Transcript_29188/m.80181 type:complete len:122 (-) Transcript_29188:260-625(-)